MLTRTLEGAEGSGGRVCGVDLGVYARKKRVFIHEPACELGERIIGVCIDVMERREAVRVV